MSAYAFDPDPWEYQVAKNKTPAPNWSIANIQSALALSPGATTGPSAGPTSGAGGAAPGSGFLPPPPSIQIPGYDPDYRALIAGDPSVIEGEAELGAYQGQLGDARRAAIRRAVIAAGLAPGSALADIDEQTRLAAQQNQFSSIAELGRSRDRSQADLGAALASRGMTFSGGQLGGSQRIQEGFERGTGQLTQALLDQIGGYESDYAGKLAEVRSRYLSLKEAAALRIQNDPRYQPLGENDAILDPGSGLYMTADGRWYDASGKRVPAPGPGAAPAAAPAAPPLPVGGLAGNPQLTIEQYADLARAQPGFYESDNAQQAAAVAAGRNYF